MRSFIVGLFLLLGLLFPVLASAAVVPKFAYVANWDSSTVSVYTIDPTTGALIEGTAVAAGSHPRSVTVDPSGRFAYVANSVSNNVSVYTINQSTGALTAGINVATESEPGSVTVDPSGKFAYVANTGSNTVSVYTINQATGALTAGTAVATGTWPYSVAVDPTGKFAYVANGGSASVSVYMIDQATGALTAGTAVAAGANPYSVAVDPTGKFAYVANNSSNNVSVYTINQTTGELIAVGTPVATGTNPSSVVVDPTGKFAYVANDGSNNVSVYTINQTTGELIAVGTPVAAGSHPISVTVDPSGKFVYVANYVAYTTLGNVSVYSVNQTTGALTEIGTQVAAGIGPKSVTTTAGSSLVIFSQTIISAIGSLPFQPLVQLIAVGTTTTVSAAATSGLAVSFSSTTPGICTVSGSTVTGVTAGTCIIAVNQAGNATYNAAPQVTQTISVIKANQTISFGAAPMLVAGGTGTVSATASSGLAVSFSSSTQSVCTVSGSTITGIAAGTCIIAAEQAGNTNYNAAAQVTQNITVGVATQTIAFGIAPTVVVGGTGTVSATGGVSGNPVTFTSTTTSICTNSGSTVTGIAAGTCTIAANQAGNANYSAAPQVTQPITVSAAAVPAVLLNPTSLTFTSQNIGTSSAAQTVTLSNTGSGMLNITSIAASGDYAKTTTCSTTLAAGANCTISVTFTPTVSGARTGAVTITSNAATSLSTISLSGTGVVAAPSAATGLMGGAIQGTPLALTGAVVTNFAGTGPNGVVYGTGTAPSSILPTDITTDGTNLYFVDDANQLIRKIVIATGEVTTLAGGGPHGPANSLTVPTVDGIGAAASFINTHGITTDGTNLYVTDGDVKIRKIVIATGEVTTIAGSFTSGFAGDGIGTAASFNMPYGITTDGTNLYVAESNASRIRKIVIATGVVTTLAGVPTTAGGGGIFGSADGIGAAATFYNSHGITTDGTNLYVADSWNNKIRKIVIATAAVTTFAGSGAAATVDGTGTAASFNMPYGITTDGTNLYVTEITPNGSLIRKVEIATGMVTTLAGSSNSQGAVNGIGTVASFNKPKGITTDGINLYVADWGNDIIRKIAAAGSTGGTTGVASVSLSATSLTFAAQNTGTSSAAQTITLTNAGSVSLNISSIAASGDYVQTTTCGTTLAAGASCTFSVTFTPTASGARTGALTITSDAAGSPHNVSLTGTGGTTGSLSTPLLLEQGWNLLGNSLNQTLTVASIFGDQNAVTTVWKWDTSTSGWQFYTPSLSTTALQTYAASKGYGVLSVINPGEGYWVNAKAITSLPTQTGASFPLAYLAQGWNLVATGNDVTPSVFNRSLSVTPPSPGVIPANLTTLWAWDNAASSWYFYAPSLEAQGGTKLTDYITSKGYLDFTQHNKTLGNGTGFWVNYAGTPNVSVPTVTGTSPGTGAAGAIVTITGTNFDTIPANNTVKFNGTQATVTAATATSLTVTVPSGATTGAVSIATVGGTITTGSSFTVSTSNPIPAPTGSGALIISGALAGHSLSGLTNWTDRDESIPWSEGDTQHSRQWMNMTTYQHAGFSYHVGIRSFDIYERLSFSGFPASLGNSALGAFWVGAGSFICEVVPSVPTPTYPACASWGITISRSAGTITFASAPVYDQSTPTITGTMDGTLSFTPF